MKASNSKIESGYQLFTRIVQRPTLDRLHPILFPQGGPHPNQIIQITGETSTGKSLLIMELIARCILPEKHESYLLPGKDSSAVIINTDHHFNLFRLIAVMESLLKSIPSNKAQIIIENSLKNLIVLNCYSSEQLRLTFQNLERILNENLNINFLAIDSFVAYYWYDRSVNGMASINLYCVSLLTELKKTINDRNIVTVFTKYEIETFNKPLNDLVNCTIYLKRVNVGKFVAIVYNNDKNTNFCKDYRIEEGFCFVD